jgi:hypothetical protein
MRGVRQWAPPHPAPVLKDSQVIFLIQNVINSVQEKLPV